MSPLASGQDYEGFWSFQAAVRKIPEITVFPIIKPPAPQPKTRRGHRHMGGFFMYGGAVCGRNAFRIDDVFDTDRHTMDQPIRWIIVEFLGGGYGRVWIEIFPGVDIGFTIFDAFEKGA